MSRYLAVPIFLLVFQMTGLAAPDPPFEDLLLRAKNVLIAEVLSTNISTEHRTVSFHVVDVLRGHSTREFTLPFETYADFKKGSQWLLLSQGDNHYGEPRNILDRPMDGQGAWCGWTYLPLLTIGNKTYAGWSFSSCDGDPICDIQSRTDGGCLELSRIKRLIRRFPYNPDVNR